MSELLLEHDLEGLRKVEVPWQSPELMMKDDPYSQTKAGAL